MVDMAYLAKKALVVDYLGEVNKIIPYALSCAGYTCVYISRIDGEKPDGLTLIPWNRGKSILWGAIYINSSSKLQV